MKPTYGKILNKSVKRIAYKHGWDIWSCYNDKRKGHRRLSYARNGWVVSEKMQTAIKQSVTRLLKEHKIKGEVYWVDSYRIAYGPYDKLCIDIPN